jgi:hypothetical protein
MSLREHIDPTIAADPELAERIRTATRQLRDAAEEAGSDVVATWISQGNGKGPAAVRLTLDAPPAKVEDRFSVEELRDPRELRWRVGRLWGHLHLTRARRLLAEAHELAAASEDAQ